MAGGDETLAMFPLGTVLFPGMLLPLHVFEPRYRLMVRATLAATGEFGVVLIERGHEVGGGDSRFDIGTRARIAQCQELPDGRYALAVVGINRVRVARWLADDPYPQAQVVDLDDDNSDDDNPDDGTRDLLAEATRLTGELGTLLRQLNHDGSPTPTAPDALVGEHADCRAAAYALCAALPWGALDAQRLLAAESTRRRLELLTELLNDEIAVARARLDGH